MICNHNYTTGGSESVRHHCDLRYLHEGDRHKCGCGEVWTNGYRGLTLSLRSNGNDCPAASDTHHNPTKGESVKTLQEKIDEAVLGFNLDEEDRGMLVSQILQTIDEHETEKTLKEYVAGKLYSATTAGNSFADAFDHEQKYWRQVASSLTEDDLLKIEWS